MGVQRESVEPELQQRFGAMYDTHLAAVYGFLSLRAGNRALAEDLTAETFTAALREFQAGRGDTVTLPWLRTVARRRLIDHWRREHVATKNVHRLRSEPAVDDTATISDRALVIDALEALSEEQRRVLVLQQVDGYSVIDIAELIGRTPKATESLLGRARTAFRDAYGGGGA